ncbi:hypothetical protein QJS04_geneDACA010606 [Acorus gramineus]|uniref:Agenet domain-containing protein n=1 Tax=Acorus gramineus TaxID=55184 RepID=A0AAV9AKJ8_ACOGR|nr:hypothetical protein QJS04_geneDACA010606 [Acorus gramineus]
MGRSVKKKLLSVSSKLSLGDAVEVRFSDEGLKGSWHQGRVILLNDKICYVEFDHLLNDDGSSKLVESVSVLFKTSKSHRGHIRPVPPLCDSLFPSEVRYGLCVDVLIDDSWWEGVIFDRDEGAERRKVIFPDQGDLQEVGTDQLRVTNVWDEVTGGWRPRGMFPFGGFMLEQQPLPVSVWKFWFGESANEGCLEKDACLEVGMEVENSMLVDNAIVEGHMGNSSGTERGGSASTWFDYISAHDDDTICDLEKKYMRGNASNYLLSVGWVFEKKIGGDVFYVSPDGKNYQSFIEACSAQKEHEKRGIAKCDEQFNGYCDVLMCDTVGSDSVNGNSVSRKIDNCGVGQIKTQMNNLTWREDPGCSFNEWKRLDIEAKYSPQTVAAYVGYLAEPEIGCTLGALKLKVKQHIVALGWSIEFQRKFKSSKFKYIAPRGKVFYSLHKLCKYLLEEQHGARLDEFRQSIEVQRRSFGSGSHQMVHNDGMTDNRICMDDSPTYAMEQICGLPDYEALNPGTSVEQKHVELPIGPLDSVELDIGTFVEQSYIALVCSPAVREDMPSNGFPLEPEYCPQAIVDYCKLHSSKNRVHRNVIRQQSCRAKKHLLAVGWTLRWRHKGMNKKEMRYYSQSNQCFYSLIKACRSLIEGENTPISTAISDESMVACDMYEIPSTSKPFDDMLRSSTFSSDPTLFGRVNKKGARGNVKRKRADKYGLLSPSRVETVLHPQGFRAHRGALKKRKPSQVGTRGKSVRALRSTQRVLQHDPKSSSGQPARTILSFLVDNNVLVPRQRVHCVRDLDGHRVEGWISREGIKCKCCNKLHSVASFQAHVDKGHVGCLKNKRLMGIESRPTGDWFCSKKCSKIYGCLHKLLGKSHPTDRDGLSWTVLKSSNGCYGFDIETVAEHYCKLSVALDVLHECFVTIIESRTGSDIVSDLLFSKGSELNRLDFRGFYTMLLEQGDEVISVATFRVYGEKVAEVPLVATRAQHRRKGMCRLLMKELEKDTTLCQKFLKEQRGSQDKLAKERITSYNQTDYDNGGIGLQIVPVEPPCISLLPLDTEQSSTCDELNIVGEITDRPKVLCSPRSHFPDVESFEPRTDMMTKQLAISVPAESSNPTCDIKRKDSLTQEDEIYFGGRCSQGGCFQADIGHYKYVYKRRASIIKSTCQIQEV